MWHGHLCEILTMPCIAWYLWVFASSSLLRVGADECRPMTFGNGDICRKMRCYICFLSSIKLGCMPVVLLTLGHLPGKLPHIGVFRVAGILSFTRVCASWDIMTLRRLIMPWYSTCTCQRLDIIAAADVRVRDSPSTCQRLDIIAATDVSVWELLLYMSKVGHNCHHRRGCVGIPPVQVKGWM